MKFYTKTQIIEHYNCFGTIHHCTESYCVDSAIDAIYVVDDNDNVVAFFIWRDYDNEGNDVYTLETTPSKKFADLLFEYVGDGFPITTKCLCPLG